MCNLDRCYVVPPYLLKAISESTECSEEDRQIATQSLAARDIFTAQRHERFNALTQARGYARAQGGGPPQDALHGRQSIVPAVLLEHIAASEEVDEETRKCAQRDLKHLKKVHDAVHVMQQGGAPSTAQQKTLESATEAEGETAEVKTGKFYRAVYDMEQSAQEWGLPGKLIRAEGQKEVSDETVNQAFENVGLVLSMYKDIFSWNSIDNQNMHVVSSVHFGRNYENAFWDPMTMQMVFGDGFTFLRNFTGCIDVIGHELTHAVTEYTSPLNYQGQSGALNEHISDVFGIMVKQRAQKEKADEADWLIGEDCIVPGVKGVALRSMKAPGTAYDDPRFGKDPQPDNFKDFRVIWEDNGGVHLFSGIPNKAFYLASMAFGGYSWEKAGKVWWQTMNSGRIPPRCTFLQFADVIVDVAEELFGDEAAATVEKAWKDVGVARRSR